jgi:hypothetical protein
MNQSLDPDQITPTIVNYKFYNSIQMKNFEVLMSALHVHHLQQ